MRFKVSGTVIDSSEPVTFMVNAPSEQEAHTIAEQRGVKPTHVAPVSDDADPIKIAKSQLDEGEAHPPRFDVAVSYEYEGEEIAKPSTIRFMALAGIAVACAALAFLALQFPKLLHPAAPPATSFERLLHYFALGNAGVLIGLHVLLLGSALGCLALKPWAHAGMIGFALLCLFVFVIQLAFLRMYTIPFEAAKLSTLRLPLPPKFQTLELMKMLPWQLLPIAILMCLRGRAVRLAFGIKDAEIVTIDD